MTGKRSKKRSKKATNPVFFDTNVFLYAAGGEHPMRTACQQVLREFGEGQLEARTSSEVVQEILHVLTRRGSPADAQALANLVLDLFPDLLSVGAEEMRLAVELLEQNTAITVRDAVHAATMLLNGMQTIVSVDTHFDELTQIQRWDPSSSRRPVR